MGLNLSVRTWITMIVLTVLMGLCNIYTTLLTGWGDTGAVVAVILCVIFFGRNQGDIFKYNLGATMITAGGAVGFAAAMMAAFYVINPKWSPPLWELALLLTSLSTLGVTCAIPLRRLVRKWFFPSGVACGVILKAVTGEDPTERRKAKRVMIGSGIISGLLTLPTKVALAEGATAIWKKISLPNGTGISLDPLYYGIGIVVGPRIGISMFLGACFSAFLFVPGLTDAGVAGAEIGSYVKWVAIGLMTIPAFVSIFLAFKYKQPQTLPTYFKPREELPSDLMTRGEILVVAVITLAAMAITAYTANDVFGVGVLPLLLCMALCIAICIMLGKVASETDINAVRLGATVVLAVMSVVVAYGAVSLLALALVGAAMASLAVDLFYNFRTGYLINANPKEQVRVLYLGVFVSGIAAFLFLHLLATTYGFGEGKYFAAPSAVVWAEMAKGFAAKGANMSHGVWVAFWIATVVGVGLSFLICHKKMRRFAPSTLAIGLALLIDFDACAAICAGSLIKVVLMRTVAKKGEAEQERMNDACFQGGSAVFAAAALIGIIAIILISFGIFHIPVRE